jgi:hypothetical protein
MPVWVVKALAVGPGVVVSVVVVALTLAAVPAPTAAGAAVVLAALVAASGRSAWEGCGPGSYWAPVGCGRPSSRSWRER